MNPATADFDRARERLTLALRHFIEVGHLRGIQMTQQRFYFLLANDASQALEDVHEQLTLAQIAYIEKLDTKHEFDPLEMLCSVDRPSEDNMYALDIELVLYKDVQSIYR
jgi:hypothetical protein